MEEQVSELVRLVAERDQLIHERNDLMNQRDALIHERNDLMKQRDALAAQCNHLGAERNDQEAQRNDLMQARDEAMHQRDALMRARDVLIEERDRLVDDRDAIYQERDLLRCQLSATAALLSPALRLLTAGQFRSPTPQPLDLSRTLICCGYWGSGNGIAAAMLERLLPDPPPPANAMMSVLRDAAAVRTTALIEDAAKLSTDYGYNRCGIATFQNSTASLSMYSDIGEGKDHTVDIFGIPIANAFHEHLFKTHEACGSHIKNLVAHGAHVVLAIRHPLDILVSVANKCAGGGIDLLHDAILLRRVLAQIRAYFSSFDELPSDRVFYSRYESIISDFSIAARDLTDFAGRARSETLDATLIQPELLDMDLSLPGHRWKPGAGKWQRYLSGDIVDIIQDEGIPELTTHLGYESPDLSLLNDDKGKERIVPEEISDTPSLMFLLHGSLHLEDAVAAVRFHAPKTIIGPLEGGAFFLTQHQSAADRLAPLVSDPRFQSILRWD
ncbi:hypothetical protein ACJ4V0_15125 [Phreatobacter sp. HK31-P]